MARMSSGRGQDQTPLSADGARKPSAQVARKLPPVAGFTCRSRAPRASVSSSPATRCGQVNWRAGAISGGAERISADQVAGKVRFVCGGDCIGQLRLFQVLPTAGLKGCVRAVGSDEGHERAVATGAADFADAGERDAGDGARDRGGARCREEELVVLAAVKSGVKRGLGGLAASEWMEWELCG